MCFFCELSLGQLLLKSYLPNDFTQIFNFVHNLITFRYLRIFVYFIIYVPICQVPPLLRIHSPMDMIHRALIFHKGAMTMLQVLLSHDDKTAIFNLPHNQLEVENYILSVGAIKPYADLCLNDDDDPEQVQAKLIADNPIDAHLQVLFSEDARLSTVNTVCDLFYRLPIEQQIDLTHKMAGGHINGEKDLMNAIKAQMTPTEPVRVNFYCPLTILMDDTESGEVVDADMDRIYRKTEKTERGGQYMSFYQRSDITLENIARRIILQYDPSLLHAPAPIPMGINMT